jgi:hypothetical protein
MRFLSSGFVSSSKLLLSNKLFPIIALQLMYVYIPAYESGGKLWPLVYKYMCAGLFIFQLTVIGIIALKYGYIQTPLLVPLPFITIVVYR